MAPQSTKRVLCVDDEPRITRNLQRILKRAGYASDRAHTGAEALSQLRSGGHALIITDIIMPDMDGIELIREARLVSRSVKIIAMSGGGKHVQPELALNIAQDMGADAVLQKPCPSDELLRAAEHCLGD